MAAEHKHLIIRAEVKKPPIDPLWATNWLTHLVKKIGMKILMGPYATYCDVPGNAGLTAAVIIETSHIVLHVWDEDQLGEIQFDVYTCSHLDPTDIFKELEQFDLVKLEYKYFNREKGLIEVDLDDIPFQANVPNRDTVAALEDSRAGVVTPIDSIDSLFGDIHE